MIFVDDKRSENDPSLWLVPQLKSLDDINKYFAKVEIDHSLGQDVADPGEGYWAVTSFYVTTGPVVLAPKVFGADGLYIQNKTICWYYTGMPQFLPASIKPRYYSESGLIVRTKHEGSGAEITLTADHYVGPPDPGPDSVWVGSFLNEKSDMVKGLGMRSGTNHLIVHPEFRWVTKSVEQPEPEPEPEPNPQPEPDPRPPIEGTNFELALLLNGEVVAKIPFKSVEENTFNFDRLKTTIAKIFER